MSQEEELRRYPLKVPCPVHPEHGDMARSVSLFRGASPPYYVCRVCERAWKVDHGGPVLREGQPVEDEP